MKAFVSAMVAMTVIAVGAFFALDALSFSSENVYRSENVRLGE